MSVAKSACLHFLSHRGHREVTLAQQGYLSLTNVCSFIMIGGGVPMLHSLRIKLLRYAHHCSKSHVASVDLCRYLNSTAFEIVDLQESKSCTLKQFSEGNCKSIFF